LCKRFCLDLTISDNSDTLLFNDENLVKIEQCTTFRELFKLLRQHWSWKEYCILKHIISESNSKEARDELSKYEKVMSSYVGLQLISQTFLPEELPHDYVKMIVIIEKPYKEIKFKEYTKIRDFVLEHMDVKPYITHPYVKFLFSSVHVEWFVPKYAVPYMVKMARKNIEKFIKNVFIYIQIGVAVILDVQKDKVSIAFCASLCMVVGEGGVSVHGLVKLIGSVAYGNNTVLDHVAVTYKLHPSNRAMHNL